VRTLALNYSARSEIVDAFRSLADVASRNGGINHMQVDERLISGISQPGACPTRLSNRTSGAMRLSKLPAVAMAYAENLCNADLWPDPE